MSNGTIPTLKSLSPSAMNMLNGSPSSGSVQFKSLSMSRGARPMNGVTVRPKGCGFEVTKPTMRTYQEPMYRKVMVPGVQKYECRPIKSCNPCPPKPCPPKKCDPCDSGSSYGGIWWAVIGFIILALIIWALLWAFRPEFVLQDDKNKKNSKKSHGSKSPRGHGSQSDYGDDHDDHDDHDRHGKRKFKDDRDVDQGKACLWAVIIALVLTFLFYLAWGCICGKRSHGSWGY